MNLADRWIEWLEGKGLQSSWATFLRIMAVATLVTLVISWALPDRVRRPEESQYAAQVSSPFVHEVGADRGDERGFFPTPNHPDQFRIVWVGGSSIQGVDPDNRTFAPAELRHRISEIDGRDVVIDMYFLSGIRIVDELAAVQSALQSKPDMVIVTLNPMWVLNDRAVHGWSNLDGRWFAGSLLTPSSWPLTASFVGPSAATWGAVGSHVDIIENRYDWGRSLKSAVGDWSPLALSPPADPPAEAAIPELARIAQMQIPVFFWDEYSSIQPAGASTADRQAAIFHYEAEHASGIPAASLRALLGALAGSGVPSFLYVAQIDDEAVAAPQVSAALARVETAVEGIAAPYESPALEVNSESAIRGIDEMDFRDIIHAFDIEPLVDYLEPQLCDFLDRQNWESSCASR